MDRRTFLSAAAGTGIAVGLAGCLDGGARATDEYDVGMTLDSFRPAELVVSAGTTVTWRNTSKHAHTVTAFEGGYPDGAEFFASGGYDSEDAAVDAWEGGFGGAIRRGEEYEHAFEVPGTYEYFCIPHLDASMTGTVRVEATGD